ncbi:MAG TPA: hypothetical protein VEA80_15440 [Vitreimonas sp.]|uniref:hypothetical protein n=1 Tax=Vitreimonas sp. TaxID=3069702 RepID=UPI002D61E3DE|nr:hypothetical protein [Vitreimonas sp.]HYD88867.1 hypothetical protein [Vitreimonas sp.]
MICDIPTSAEFETAALNLLNLAWSIGIDIATELDEAHGFGVELNKKETADFWSLAQPALGNGFALVQQAQEMALKGRIAAISPFLLISGAPREWPSGSSKQDTSFARFRTIDAADLIKVLHTVCDLNGRLPTGFEEFFERVRLQRNAIVHAGGIGRQVEVTELLIGVLQTARDLFPAKSWAKRRREYCENDRIAITYSTDHVGYQVLREFGKAHGLLKPAERQTYFGTTKARLYSCPQCRADADRIDEEIIALAQLRPNLPTSTQVYCFVCEEETAVERRQCTEEDCLSNVICADPNFENECLLCCCSQS